MEPGRAEKPSRAEWGRVGPSRGEWGDARPVEPARAECGRVGPSGAELGRVWFNYSKSTKIH